MLSREANAVFQKAADYASKMGDQFVSLEHLLLAILSEKNSASQMMKDAGISLSQLQSAIRDLRQGEKVTSQSAEDTYQSLGKYAVNLAEQARNGKLDPVIGRDEEIRRVLQILSRRTKNNPPFLLVSRGRVRRLLPKDSHTELSEAMCRRILKASRSILSIWGHLLQAQNTRESLRSV